ncbi:hypothetical protein BBJ28_00019130 [Nothophytophthora sp. Chile5]|nr:hypothetical protein BBJ28_00019130 [Nothophytophthora sp. Chile5]
MADASSLQTIQKCKQRATTEEGLRVSESQCLVEPLLTSWFDVINYSDVSRSGPWRTSRIPAALAQEDLQEDLRAVGELSEENKEPINSVIKLRLYSTTNHRENEVRDSASRDFMKAVKSSLALYFALRKKEKKTSFPELKFKSKFAPSNSIEIGSRGVTVVHREKDYVRFHPTVFGSGKSDGIELREKLPEPTHSI